MDTELVIKAQRGEEAAMAALIAGCASRLRSVAWSVLRDRDLADDAAQQAMVALWRSLPSLRDPASFEAWSYRLTVRACQAELRKHRRTTPTSLHPEIESNLVEDLSSELDAVHDRQQLERALAHLTTPQRAVVALHHFEGLTLERVAEVLDVPVGTVWSRLHRAMDGLRAALAADARGPGAGSLGADPAPDAPWRPSAAVRPWVAGGIRPAPATDEGRTIVVAQDGTGDAATIGQAMRIARDGDLVLVRPGVYRESVTVTRDIAIVGDGDRDDVVIDFHGSAARAVLSQARRYVTYGCTSIPFGVLLDGTRACIANLTIRGPRDAVAIVAHGGAPSILHVAGRLDGGWQGPGALRHFLFMSGGATGHIADCTSSAHVHIEDASSPVIEHNELSGALLVHSVGSRPLVRQNLVVVGGRSRWCMGVTGCASPTIERNEFAWVDGSAITLWCAGGATVRDNVIRGSRTGITVADGRSSPVTVEGNDISARTAAIVVGGSRPIVTGNLLRGPGASALVLAAGGRPVLEGNAIAPVQGGRRVAARAP